MPVSMMFPPNVNRSTMAAQSLGLQCVQHVPHLGLDSRRVGLFEDGPQQRGHPGLGGLGDLAQQISGVMKPSRNNPLLS